VIIWDIDRVHFKFSGGLVNFGDFLQKVATFFHFLAGKSQVWEEFYKAIKPSFVPPYIHWIEVAAIVNAARFLVKLLGLLAEIPLSFFSSPMYV